MKSVRSKFYIIQTSFACTKSSNWLKNITSSPNSFPKELFRSESQWPEKSMSQMENIFLHKSQRLSITWYLWNETNISCLASTRTNTKALSFDFQHRKGIVHRDIKADNIFFANSRLIKLGDFGFSTKSDRDELLSTFCGSPPYAAPELYSNEEYSGFLVDIWAMGILLYFMVTALMPFREENLTKLKKSVINGEYSIPGFLSVECQELIRESSVRQRNAEDESEPRVNLIYTRSFVDIRAE